PLPASRSTETHAINDAGDVLGWFLSGPDAFLLRGGSLTTFTVPGSTLTAALGMNNLGVIVGTYADAASRPHSYVLSDGRYSEINVPGAFQTVPCGINDA